jgi:amino acid transporter
MAVIAKDGFLPKILAERKNNIPKNAIIFMALISGLLILIGGLQLILEFGSITFLFVSLLMAIANYKIKEKTKSSKILTLLAIIGLTVGTILILYYEFKNNWAQMVSILFLYFILALGAWIYSRKRTNTS